MIVRPSHSDYYCRAPRKVLPPPVVSVTTSPQGRRRRRRAPCRWLGPLLRRRAPRRLGREGRAAAVRGSECLGGGGRIIIVVIVIVMEARASAATLPPWRWAPVAALGRDLGQRAGPAAPPDASSRWAGVCPDYQAGKQRPGVPGCSLNNRWNGCPHGPHRCGLCWAWGHGANDCWQVPGEGERQKKRRKQQRQEEEEEGPPVVEVKDVKEEQPDCHHMQFDVQGQEFPKRCNLKVDIWEGNLVPSDRIDSMLSSLDASLFSQDMRAWAGLQRHIRLHVDSFKCYLTARVPLPPPPRQTDRGGGEFLVGVSGATTRASEQGPRRQGEEEG